MTTPTACELENRAMHLLLISIQDLLKVERIDYLELNAFLSGNMTPQDVIEIITGVNHSVY